MKRRHPQQGISADEQIARYAYALGNIPVSVADHAYAAAFARLSPEQREDLLGQLHAELGSDPEAEASADPVAFAVAMRDLRARSALVGIRSAASFAAEFVASAPVVAYFTTGAGSVTMDHQPPWVHDLAGHETAPIDSGRAHHRAGVPSRDWPGG